MKYSRFYCKNNRYSRKIYHSALNLSELAINEGDTLFTWSTSMFRSRVNDDIEVACCCTDQILESQCQTTIDKSSSPKDPMFVDSIIYNGKNLIYRNRGHNDLIKVPSNKVDEDGILRYTIEYSSGELDEVPCECLSRLDIPDMASIPTVIP